MLNEKQIEQIDGIVINLSDDIIQFLYQEIEDKSNEAVEDYFTGQTDDDKEEIKAMISYRLIERIKELV